MVAVVFLIAGALVLFWILPLGFAIAGAVVAALLVAARLHDAVRHGRRAIAARQNGENAESEIPNPQERNAVFHALWIGLTVSASSRDHDSGSYVQGQHGDSGGDYGGGFGDGGSGDPGGL